MNFYTQIVSSLSC